MVKDPESAYSPGRRGLAWLKLKRPLATLDCAVTAVEWGHGKRRGPPAEAHRATPPCYAVVEADLGQLGRNRQRGTLRVDGQRDRDGAAVRLGRPRVGEHYDVG